MLAMMALTSERERERERSQRVQSTGGVVDGVVRRCLLHLIFE